MRSDPNDHSESSQNEPPNQTTANPLSTTEPHIPSPSDDITQPSQLTVKPPEPANIQHHISSQSPKDHSLTLEPEMELSIEKGGFQMIDINPIDTALQALSRLPVQTNFPVARTWTAADTALCLATAIGYTLTLGLAFILFNRVNGVQRSMNRCTAAFPRTFKRNHRKRGNQAETMLNLITVNTTAGDPKAEEN
ncbi:hypothetical protein G5714_021593 [Onychostoma macrolepis]|uniref:Uncharacterized protein n=1 Tax=Onychostoma macrolepis TaxID=369639 RepID=A0A7J6BTE6_9TELE|nr:hypothetical protein G5714_021593 [Onychostoma macrolepis]